MKIRKVDDKPMVIHTKEKAKIHAHEPKGAKIKGSNIYTVERGPKVHDVKANEMDKKASAKLMLQKSTDGKSTYRKSTIHQSEARKTITGNLQRGHSPSLRLEVRMDLKDMILVTENDRGTETNMLMTLDDYKSFIAVDDMSELAENLLQLGRTLGEADNFTEYYRAANVTVSARFCLDDIQLGHFLQGFYNDSKEFRFDKEASSYECVAKLKEIGMTDKGWVDDFNLHYEMENRSFERGQTFHNFNDHDYMVLEALSPRNLVVMDMKSGSLTIALGATEYKRYPKDEKPTKDNTTKQVDEQGKPIYQDVCYPVTKDFREKLYNEIISEYEKAKDKSNEKARESAEKHHGNPDKEKDKEATPFR